MHHALWVKYLSERGVYRATGHSESSTGLLQTGGSITPEGSNDRFHAIVRTGSRNKRHRIVEVDRTSIFEEGLVKVLEYTIQHVPKLKGCKIFLSRVDDGDCSITYYMELLLEERLVGGQTFLMIQSRNPSFANRYSQEFD